MERIVQLATLVSAISAIITIAIAVRSNRRS